MMRRRIVAFACALAFVGCGGPAVPVGQVAKLKPFTSTDLKTWVARDEDTLRKFLLPASQFNPMFDGLRAQKKIFRESQGTRIKILERKDLGAMAVRGSILTGPNAGAELWIFESQIEPESVARR